VIKLPTPPRLERERERFFRFVYDHAVSKQEHIIDLYFLHAQSPEFSIREHAQAWQSAGFGRLIEERDSYNQCSLHFALNDKGLEHGEHLIRRARTKSFRTRAAKNFWPAFNGFAAWLAAIAAAAAAYFSYLGLQH
jgi:hypothetical protein